jgi:hypothetical protein
MNEFYVQCDVAINYSPLSLVALSFHLNFMNFMQFTPSGSDLPRGLQFAL